MADANKEQLAYLAESTWGTTPTSAMTIIPWVSGAMASGLDTTRSNSLRTDAQLSSSIQTGSSPSGNFEFEMTADTYDDFLKSVIRTDADWSTSPTFSGTGAVTSTQFTGTGIHTNVAVGQWVYITAPTVSGLAAGNTGWFKVTAVATDAITTSPAPSETDASVANMTVDGSYITNGSTLSSYTFAQNFSDLSNKYHTTTGCRLNSGNLTFTPNGIVTFGVGYDGKAMTQATAWAGGSASAAASKDVASEVTAYESAYISADAGTAEAYAKVTEDVLESSISLAVENRPQKGLGSIGNTSMAQNSVDATGSIQFYVNANTWAYEGYFLAFTKFGLAQSLNFGTADDVTSITDRYLIEFPKIALTTEPGANSGLNTDLVYAFDFAAEPGGTIGSDAKTITITKT